MSLVSNKYISTFPTSLFKRRLISRSPCRATLTSHLRRDAWSPWWGSEKKLRIPLWLQMTCHTIPWDWVLLVAHICKVLSSNSVNPVATRRTIQPLDQNGLCKATVFCCFWTPTPQRLGMEIETCIIYVYNVFNVHNYYIIIKRNQKKWWCSSYLTILMQHRPQNVQLVIRVRGSKHQKDPRLWSLGECDSFIKSRVSFVCICKRKFFFSIK